MKYERIAILNALAAYYTNLGKTRKRQRDEYFIKAVDFYNRAAKIDTEELTTFVGKGINHGTSIPLYREVISFS